MVSRRLLMPDELFKKLTGGLCSAIRCVSGLSAKPYKTVTSRLTQATDILRDTTAKWLAQQQFGSGSEGNTSLVVWCLLLEEKPSYLSRAGQVRGSGGETRGGIYLESLQVPLCLGSGKHL